MTGGFFDIYVNYLGDDWIVDFGVKYREAICACYYSEMGWKYEVSFCRWGSIHRIDRFLDIWGNLKVGKYEDIEEKIVKPTISFSLKYSWMRKKKFCDY